MQQATNKKDEIGEFFNEKIPRFMKETFNLEETEYKILAWIPVLYKAWELDDWAVVIQTSDQKKILLHSDHGATIVVEDPKAFLTERIDYYQTFINKSAAALKILD